MPRCDRLLPMAALLLAVVVFPPIVRAQEKEQVSEGERVFKQAVRSMVWILVPLPDGKRAESRGSGCLIDAERRLVLTAHHVMNHDEKVVVVFPTINKGDPISEQDFYLQRLARGLGVPGRVIASDPQRDLAVVQLKSLPKGIPALKMAAKPPGVGTEVHSIGNPGGTSALWVYTAGKVRAVYERRWQGGDAKGQNMNPYHAHVIMTDSPINPGDSGGPLLNGNGELIGLTHGFSQDTFRLAMFIDIREGKELLKTRGVQSGGSVVTSSPPRPASTSDKSDAVKPADAKPSDAPVDAEKHALIKYKMAKELADVGLNEKARVRCEKILEEFPNTKGAEDAKILLEKLKDKKN